MLRTAILDDYQGVALGLADWQSLRPDAEVAAFSARLSGAALVRELRSFHCIVAMRERTPFPRALLDELPNLRLLVTTGMRNASIDLDAATACGIQVCGTSMLPFSTAELTWALILALTRRIPEEDRALRKGLWQTTLGQSLRGKTLGIIGLGKLGVQVSAIAKAFMMEVVAWSQNLTQLRAQELGVTRVEKDELFAQSDVITIHVVLSARTRGLIGARDLALMKPGAYIINTSRGPVVDESALIDALRRRHIAGAGLDVFDQEPLAKDHALLALDNAIVTPHLGYVTEDDYRLAFGEAVADIRAFLDGKVLRPLNQPGGPA